MAGTVTLAVSVDETGWSYYGHYQNENIARKRIETALAEGYELTWRRPRIGEILGAFSNHTVPKGSGWVVEAKPKDPEYFDAILLFVGSYSVAG